MMKNGFYFTLKALFLLEMFKFLSWLLGFEKAKVNFKMYDVAEWTTKNCNTYIVQYLKK